jgi:DNA repair exonuclease SbcCD nuclease subunit
VTKLAIIADVHVGNHRRCGGVVENGLNERCRLAIDALRRAGELALEQGCEALLILGDLFETSDPSPRMVAATMDVLDEIHGLLSHGVIVMAGNHDAVSSAVGDNALGPTRFVTAQVIDEPWYVRVFSDNESLVTFVPYRPGRAEDWLPPAVVEAMGEGSQEEVALTTPGSSASRLPLRALALHLGIIQPVTPAYLKASPDAVDYMAVAELARAHGFRTVVAGHWHQHWRSDPIGGTDDFVTLVQVGALCPRGWSDEGAHLYGRVVVLEAGKLPEVLEVGGPRFLKATGKGGLKDAKARFKRQKELEGSLLYLDWRVPPDLVEQAGEELQAAIEAGDVHRGEVNLDDAVIKTDVRAAAAAVRTSDSLDEAVAKFVDGMELPDGVSREAVLERARGYLTGGAE